MTEYIFLGGILLGAVGYWIIAYEIFKDKNKKP